MLIHDQAAKYGSRPAITYREFGSTKWKSITWNYFSQRVRQVSNALLNLNVEVQENIGVFSQNAVYSLFTDFGAYGVRAVTIPFYATSSEQQIQYMIDDAQVRLLFVGEQEQYDKARRIFSLCPTLERVIIFDANVYTSGTTGDSKGVILTHGQYHAAMIANAATVPVGENDRVMNFLPYTHIFERGWTYLCITVGARLIVNTYPKEIQESLRETHPTCMCSVPRFWEKVYAGVHAKIDEASGAKKALFKSALRTGRKHNLEYLARGKRPSPVLSLKYQFYNKMVFSLIRKELGLENAHFFPTAGAKVSEEVEEFIHSIGINMVVGYGLTESLATVTHDHFDQTYTIGSVGRPIEGIEIKIGENDEVLLKGPTITRGYYKRPALDAQAFDEEGFFHTGDAGYMLNGELFLKERIKDLFKTSNGKYIAPQMIESKLLVDKYIEQVAVIADERKFVSALVIPNYSLIEAYAKSHDIAYASREELCANPRIYKMLANRIETLQQSLASYEKVKRFTVLPKPFSMESGELTNTLKIRRGVLIKNYASEIEEMYKE